MHKIHKVCELFPPMNPHDFDALKASIKEHGLKVPVVLHENQIVDGKNRARACEELGVKYETVNWKRNGSLVHWAVAMNLPRRHMTVSERGALAPSIVVLFAKECAARQKAGKGGDTLAPKGAKVESGKAADKAAKSLGVSTRTVERAVAIDKAAPEKLAEVAAGKKTIRQAEREVKEAAPKDADNSIVPDAPKDGLGRPVADKLLWAAFNAESFTEVLSTFRKAKMEMKALCDRPEGAGLSQQTLEIKIDEISRTIKQNKPYAPCVYHRDLEQCKKSKCKACKGQGWLCKLAYEGAPEDMRKR